MTTYVTLTKTNTYKYRRKVPSELKEYLQKNEIIKSLGKNEVQANKQAYEYNTLINESIELATMLSIPSDVRLGLIYNKLLPLSTVKATKVQPKETLKEVAQAYLESLSVSESEIRDRSYILLEIFPSVFKVLFNKMNPTLESLKYTDLVKARNILDKFPKRNIEKYRRMSLIDIAKGIHLNTLSIPEEETISITTLNKYLKWFSTLMTFALRQNIISSNPTATGLTIKNTTMSRNQRKEFSIDELVRLEQSLKGHHMLHVYNMLKYTGMRLSELLKCDISEVDGLLSFDLRTPEKPLKTLSSYRVIPVHKELMDSLKVFKSILMSYNTKSISHFFSNLIHRTLEDPKGKSLYSLRHTFATTLIAKGVQPEVVSELMGHAHSTMTMNRYVKGYPVSTLKKAIDKL